MKRLTCIYLLVFLALTGCQKQRHTSADTFLEYGLLTQSEYEALVNSNHGKSILNDAAAIRMWIDLRRISSGSDDKFDPDYFYPGPVQLRKMADGMQQLGLATRSERLLLDSVIRTGEVRNRSGMLRWPTQYRNFRRRAGPAALRRLTDSWIELGMIDSAHRTKIHASIDVDQREAALSLPQFMKRAAAIPISGWNFRKAEDVFNLYDPLLKLLPGAKLNEIGYSLDSIKVENASKPSFAFAMELSLKLDGRMYTKSVDVFPNPIPNGPGYSYLPFDPEMAIDPLNQYLLETESPERIVTMEPNSSIFPEGVPEKLWFARLTKEQYHAAFEPYECPWSVNLWAFKPSFTSAQVDSIYDILQKYGALDGIFPFYVPELRRKSFLEWPQFTDVFLDHIPNLTARFATHWPPGHNPYPDYIADLERISRGGFKLDSTEYYLGSRGAHDWHIRFRFGGKQYDEALAGRNYYKGLGVHFFGVFNQALLDAGDKRQFQFFDFQPDGVSCIFLTDENMNGLISHDLVPITDF